MASIKLLTFLPGLKLNLLDLCGHFYRLNNNGTQILIHLKDNHKYKQTVYPPSVSKKRSISNENNKEFCSPFCFGRHFKGRII